MAKHVRYAAGGWGVGELVYDDGLLVWHELPRAAPPAGGRGAGEEAPDALARRLRGYFDGDRSTFDDVELDLEWCSPFQRDVLETMRRVPYGEVAALAGRPGAQRAVGSVCAGNRFPIFVPCHRVVAASGLGPYGTLGSDYKRRLLELEGVVL